MGQPGFPLCRWCHEEVEIGRDGTIRNVKTHVVNCPAAPENKGRIRPHALLNSEFTATCGGEAITAADATHVGNQEVPDA